MNPDKFKDSPLCSHIAEKSAMTETKHGFLMALYLIEQMKNPDSFWKPYVDILPTDFSTYPWKYNEEEVEMCIGSNLFTLKEDKEKIFLEWYDRAFEEFPEFRIHSKPDFFNARLLRDSRVFSLKGKDRNQPSFVPYADMLNHKKPEKANTKWEWNSDE